MNKLVQLIQEYKKETFFDEDGNELRILLSTGASLDEILEFELKEKMNLPSDLKNLLLFSNGIELFGQCILPFNQMEFYINSSVLSFHSWGNGDFDCILVNNEYSEEKVFFMSHSENNLTPVSNSLFDWTKGVIDEIKQKGTLLHPDDYLQRSEEGMYNNLNRKNNL